MSKRKISVLGEFLQYVWQMEYPSPRCVNPKYLRRDEQVHQRVIPAELTKVNLYIECGDLDPVQHGGEYNRQLGWHEDEEIICDYVPLKEVDRDPIEPDLEWIRNKDRFDNFLAPKVNYDPTEHQCLRYVKFERHSWCFKGLFNNYDGEPCRNAEDHTRPFLACLFELAYDIVNGDEIVWMERLHRVCSKSQDDYRIFTVRRNQEIRTYLHIEAHSWEAYQVKAYSPVEFSVAGYVEGETLELLCEQALRASLAGQERAIKRCLRVMYGEVFGWKNEDSEKIVDKKVNAFLSKLYVKN